MDRTPSESTSGAPEDWLKIPEVAKELRIPRSRAYQLVAQGDLPAVRLGERSLRVHRSQLECFLLELRPAASRANTTEHK